ncbi:MAG: isoprenylcysteine carboxyl methyltransferase [Deltaproteobacteria bacterium]|jgi:protein-S-isoprenylcysteine O-methyltransferase Ste14|nr:isoprenylcysteine carboxyl methyltransferase [Deltaproteobacteria bacterium]
MSEAEERKGAAVRFPPPFVPLIGLVVGLGLDWIVWPLPNPVDGSERFAIGGAALAGGIALLLIAAGLFRETGQDPKPWKESPELIATGIYRWTRNPMYLSMGLLQAAIGLLCSSLWVVALVPVSLAVIYRIAIRHEEAYLEEKFGTPYLEYKRSVRRWL